MTIDSQLLADFQGRLGRLRTADEWRWEASRRLVDAARASATLARLVNAIRDSSQPIELKDALLTALQHGQVQQIQQLPGERLKELTGLSPTKAIRALCLLFGLIEVPGALPISTLTAAQVEQFVRTHRNPFDLLLEADVASVLDLGAGDLSFATELTDSYTTRLQEQHKDLILHCLDRLHPRSRLGGPLHPEPARLEHLRSHRGLHFHYWGDQDMFALSGLDQTSSRALRYAIVTCWAPATPTFAYEPSRLSQDVIRRHLQHTKGSFRTVSMEGEDALEVQHGGRTLLFPPWKFDIRGPLALLELMARRGSLCILGAVDTQVFWEILSQLYVDSRTRPPDVILQPENLAQVFGDISTRLNALPIGDAQSLAELDELRTRMPHVLEPVSTAIPSYRFRYIEVRRGAIFESVPASSTARHFGRMSEEAPPWFIILIPDSVPASAM